jgi:hypothetical protein
MRLESMSVVLRQRSAWEAMDLGYAMMQHWYKPVMKAWLAVYVPATLIIGLFAWRYPVLAAVVLWWLKPAFDRVVLHVLAGAVFGSTPTLRETVRALKHLWWKNGLFAALTYARFNLARSFTLPVVQLEGSRGSQARKRRSILGAQGWSAGVGLTWIALHVEFVMVVSAYLLVFVFTPGETMERFTWQTLFAGDANASGVVYLLMNAVVVSFLEPFYVAAGFAIYLNCRTNIEGWDVELAFKRMALRIKADQPTSRTPSSLRRVAVMLLAAGLFAGTVNVEPVAAAEPARPASDVPATNASDEPEAMPEDDSPTEMKEPGDSADMGITPQTGAAEAAVEILDGKEFGENQKSWKLKYVGPEWSSEREKPKQRDWNFLEGLARVIGESARVIAWIGGGLLVLFILYAIARHISVHGWAWERDADAPDVLFGLDVRPESLPDDIAASARQLLAEGDVRGAVSLLYRGALVSLIQDGRIEIARGDTELECVMRVRRAYGAEESGVQKADYFASLVSLWQRVAYAQKPVPAADVSALIDRWAAHFLVRRAAGSPTRANGARESLA